MRGPFPNAALFNRGRGPNLRPTTASFEIPPRGQRSPARLCPCTAALLQIGDNVIFDGRSYVVIGVTPMSVVPPRVELAVPETSVRLWVDVGDSRLDAPSPDPAYAPFVASAEPNA